jgi:NADPH2:quinone reductase
VSADRFLSVVASVYTRMSIRTTMRALQQMSLDGPRGLRLVDDAAVPRPRRGEILIRVAAAGVNFVDVVRARGTFGDNPEPPFVAGFEAVGEVVALGEGVTSPALGAQVIGAGAGAFAEYMVLPAAAAGPVPTGWAAEDALGLAINWPTALAALKLGRVTTGETVLVQAAAGATGRAAVKLAKHFGARVIGAASSSKHDLVRASGADHVVDSRDENLAAGVRELTSGRGADLVLESAGGAAFEASLAATRRITGRVVVVGLAGGNATVSNWDLVYRNQVQLIGFNLGALIQSAPQIFGQVMGELGGLIAAGVVAPARPKTYGLADGPRALVDLETRATVGKLALLP